MAGPTHVTQPTVDQINAALRAINARVDALAASSAATSPRDILAGYARAGHRHGLDTLDLTGLVVQMADIPGLTPELEDKQPLDTFLTTISAILGTMGAPSGIKDTSTGSIAFSDATRTLSITGYFDVYIDGVLYTNVGGSIQIPNATGLYFIYYDEFNTLTQSTVRPAFHLPFLATVYWNATLAKGKLGDERHGTVMDWKTHLYLHDTVGARFETGLASSFTNTTFSTAGGAFHDEDIEHVITAQTLCDVFYKNGSADYQWDADATLYYKSVAGTLQYNNGNVLTNVPNNNYCAYWLFVTNNPSRPIVALMGQRVDVLLNDARANNKYEALSLGTLPFQEMKLLYRVLIRNFAGTPTFIEAEDLRSVSNLPAGSFTALSHGALGDLRFDLSGHFGTFAQFSGLISDWQVDNTSDLNKPISTAMQTILDYQGEPTGFPDRTTSTLSFVDGTRTFTIQPVTGSFVYLIHGIQYTISTPKTVVIPNTTGTHYIYFDNTMTLISSTTFSTDILSNKAYVASIYWNATAGKSVVQGEERHGVVMDYANHVHWHFAVGTTYRSGLGPGNIIADGDGSLDAHAQFSIADGQIEDEDILHTITDGSPQDISPILNAPVIYRVGAAAEWNIDTPTAFPVKPFPAGRLAYNSLSGGVWGQTEAGNNDYVMCHVLATNDIRYPIMAVQGQARYGTIGAAREAARAEMSNLSGLPFQEFKPVATFIYQTSNTYANAVKARIRTVDTGGDYIDWRSSTISPSVSPSDHASLSGLQGGAAGEYYHLTSAQYTALFNNPMTTDGDLITRTAGVPARIGIGAAGTVLTSNGTAPTWAAPGAADITRALGYALVVS